MIIVKLMGGLGNQMFQFAAGKALSLNLNTNLYFDLQWFDHVKTVNSATQRSYELDVFGIKPKSLGKLRLLKLKRQGVNMFSEGDYGYQTKFETLSGNIILDGYWQSYKYFHQYEDRISKIFAFPYLDESIVVKNQIMDTDSVSVHIRRGDYAHNSRVKKIHGLLPLSYYESAIKVAVKGLGNPYLFIFTDEPEWAKKNINFRVPHEIVNIKSINKNIDEMHLMSLCKNNIIANSSFSWWAAWMNKNSTKKVVAPKKWFTEQDSYLDDRLPEDWIQM